MTALEAQPTPTVTAADVERIVRRDFHASSVTEVFAILAAYGGENPNPEPDRVRLATLKLAAGDIRKLRQEIERAGYDYRDALALAEYPAYMKKVAFSRSVSKDQKQKIIEADWSQYQEWLYRA